jgi:hypothetical protein
VEKLSQFDSMEIKDIINRIFKSKEYEAYHSFLSDPAYLLFFGLFAPAFLSIILLGTVSTVWVVIIVVLMIWGISLQWVTKQKKKYRLDDDEYLAYYSFFIRNPLEESRKAKQSVRDDYNKKSVKLTKEFLRIIRERWTIGKFKLAKETFEKPLNDLLEGLKFRIIPSINANDEKQIETVKLAMIYLEEHSKNFQINNITEFNNIISSLPLRKQNLTGSYSNVGNWINSHKFAKGTIYMAIILLACGTFGYLSSAYFGIPNEYAYGGTIAIFVALMEILFHRK